MKKLFLSFLMMLTLLPLAAANKYDNPDTLVVSRDGTGEFRTRRNSSSLHGSPTSPSVVKTVITLSSHGTIMPTSRCLQVDSIQKLL